jgi:Recombination directionality factor-like
MPIISLQRRLRQAGRIRIGAKVPTRNGGSRPSKLDAFRFTSPDEAAIAAVADAYGGEVQKWDGAAVGMQWEVYAKVTELDIIVPPTDIAFSQWYELWSGGGCQRRCDGERNILNDSPCVCDPSSPECKPTTRLNVILSQIEGIGVWRLESHGYNSAAELSGSIEVLKVMQARGAMVPGRLLLEQRQSKRIDPASGKAETFNFAVPVLDFKFNVAQVASGGPPVTPLPSGVPEPLSVAEQIGATEPRELQRRSNAAAPLPDTGLKPKTVAKDATPGGASTRSMRRLMALIRGNKDVPDDDDARHEWAAIALDHPVKSFNDLTQAEVSKLSDIAEGKAPLVPDEKQDEKKYDENDPERPF